MPNIEIKARCRDLNRAKVIAQKHSTDYLGVLHQIDTNFRTRKGRLKLREINGVTFQLIPYVKDYNSGPMKCNYAILPVADANGVKELFEKVLGIEFVMDKRREVFLIENVRIHLDQVAGLGTFIEFEAVYTIDTEAEVLKQTQKIHDLMKIFEIQNEDLLDRSYVDYLVQGVRIKDQSDNSLVVP